MMIILGIETSCDETAAAIVKSLPNGGVKVLSNVVASSADMHAKTGGIIPEEAARKQVESIIPVIQESLEMAFLKNHKSQKTRNKQNSNIKTQSTKHSAEHHPANYHLLATDVDAIAVTYGPGLIGSLLVGVETAKTLSMLWKKPLIPVNHLKAHIYANFVREGNKKQIPSNKQISSLKSQNSNTLPTFPTLALVVSGGHTDLVYMKNHEDIKWIGGTRDDAAGEAFDKTARLLGLPYPGGPEISKAADKYISDIETRNKKQVTNNHQASNHKIQAVDTSHAPLTLFPRPMIGSDDFDWSFSGLKTSVLNYTKQHNDYDVNHLSAEIQEAIVDVLVKKSMKAVDKYNPESFILSGGVSANRRLKEKFAEEFEKRETTFHAPQPNLSTDNAVAIAACAAYHNSPVDWREVTANPELEIFSE